MSLAELRRLHAEPKNTQSRYAFASPAQMVEYHAMHDAFPALVEAVEAARVLAESGELDPHEDVKRDALRDVLAKFDFGDGE